MALPDSEVLYNEDALEGNPIQKLADSFNALPAAVKQGYTWQQILNIVEESRLREIARKFFAPVIVGFDRDGNLVMGETGDELSVKGQGLVEPKQCYIAAIRQGFDFPTYSEYVRLNTAAIARSGKPLDFGEGLSHYKNDTGHFSWNVVYNAAPDGRGQPQIYRTHLRAMNPGNDSRVSVRGVFRIPMFSAHVDHPEGVYSAMLTPPLIRELEEFLTQTFLPRFDENASKISCHTPKNRRVMDVLFRHDQGMLAVLLRLERVGGEPDLFDFEDGNLVFLDMARGKEPCSWQYSRNLVYLGQGLDLPNNCVNVVSFDQLQRLVRPFGINETSFVAVRQEGGFDSHLVERGHFVSDIYYYIPGIKEPVRKSSYDCDGDSLAVCRLRFRFAGTMRENVVTAI